MAAKVLGISMPEELVRRLDDVAASRRISRSALVADLVEDGLGEQELQVKALADPVVGSALIQAMARPEVLRALLKTMREDLTDDQLLLFTQGMHAMEQTISAVAKPRRSAKPAKRSTNKKARAPKGTKR